MKHEADAWIAGHWQDKQVRQVSSCDGTNIGRTSKVVDTTFDENGALHCKTEDGYWCPASRLEIQETSTL